MAELRRRDASLRAHSDSQQTLLTEESPRKGSGRERVVPRRMQYGDISTVYDTMHRANAGDPLQRFLLATSDSAGPHPIRTAARKLLYYVQYATEVHARIAWVVQGGASYMRFGDPFRPKTWLTRAADCAAAAALGWVLTKQQRARRTEFRTKLLTAVHARLGDGARRMVEVAILMTAPECQGRGYASALVRGATGLADAHGVGSFVVSSNVANRGFYRACGFEIVETLWVGDEPTWDGELVPVDLMARELEQGRAKEAEAE
ncbi:GNAT family N-acetyltransferase [Phanerochaete sordida]|uniref:GNAT family N-acetyltransferase n=1 Tax=Phanerochaete sordida TaxID=48140 RepID=A0A9P3GIA1_9APHY|nr:GNAT family N-acetyltransferase [Phanerochaete sordida]